MRNEFDEKLKNFILHEIIRKDSLLVKMFSAENLEKLAQSFAKTLAESGVSLNEKDLENQDVRETLKFGCRMQAAQMLDPSQKIDMSPALKPLMDKHKEEKEEELEKSFLNVLTDLLKLKLNKPNKKAISEEEQHRLENKLKDLSYRLSKHPKASGLLIACAATLLRESIERRTLYGVDTHNPGEVFAPVLGVQAGNQMGAQDLSTHGENFMAEYDKASSDQPDPNGVRMSAIVNALADGHTTEYELGLQKMGVLPGAKDSDLEAGADEVRYSTTPRLVPPGSK